MRFEDLIMVYFCIYMKSVWFFVVVVFFSSQVTLPFFFVCTNKNLNQSGGRMFQTETRGRGTQQEMDRQEGGAAVSAEKVTL